MSWNKFCEKVDKFTNAPPHIILFAILVYVIWMLWMYKFNNIAPDNMLIIILLLTGIKGDQIKEELMREIRKIKEK